jgi:mono/diheme cytochrome c family protein
MTAFHGPALIAFASLAFALEVSANPSPAQETPPPSPATPETAAGAHPSTPHTDAAPAPAPASPVPTLYGAAIYKQHCVECHGQSGEGVAGKADDTLAGDRTLESLGRYIDKNMPEEDPDAIGAEESRLVAAYIYDAFYSPTARARSNPPALAVARLTNRQFRESVADLFGSFEEPLWPGPPTGLNAVYHESNGMNKKARLIASREDRRLEFDFGEGAPVLGCSPEQYSIAWQGSLLVRYTGWHEFRLTTPNGARLYLNGDFRPGDGNRRDDSAAQRIPALIDAWVSSGNTDRTETVRVFLLGGRSYPIRLDYFKYMDRRGAVKLEWEQPDAAWEVLGTPYLSPSPARHVTVTSTDFPADDASEGYERGTAVNKAWHEATTRAALEVANQVITRLPRLSRTDDTAPDRVDKWRAFLATVAERAFRRPLSSEDRAFFVDRCFADGLAPELAVKRSLLLILKSPRFLYPDLGRGQDDYAVATRLALDAWDSLPDASLRQAASDGHLRTEEQVRAQARRLMDDPRAKAKLHEFFRVWLAVDKGRDLRKDLQVYPGFDEHILADLKRSLELFVDEVIWDQNADYRRLLEADYLLLNQRLAAFYGVDASYAGEEFVPVRLDADQRAGVITHPYLLASHSYFNATSPIHRGVYLTRQVLGRALKPPPQAILFEEEHFDPSLTMREKVTTITGKESCMTCHVTINPLGFSLENFDAVGRFRTTDNHKPVQTESAFQTAEGETITLRGPRDVAGHAATAASARRGFIRQLFHSFVKQPPAAFGPDTEDALDASFTASGHHIRHLAAEITSLAALRAGTPAKQASR